MHALKGNVCKSTHLPAPKEEPKPESKAASRGRVKKGEARPQLTLSGQGWTAEHWVDVLYKGRAYRVIYVGIVWTRPRRVSPGLSARLIWAEL